MKCLSLIQPWALLVVLGAKRYETRGWQTDFRGRLAIHASRKFPEEARLLCQRDPFRTLLQRAGYKRSTNLPTGGILGSVELVDCLSAHAVLARIDKDEIVLGDYRPGRWVWQLDEPFRLAVPVTYAGRLGLFDVPEFLEDSFQVSNR